MVALTNESLELRRVLLLVEQGARPEVQLRDELVAKSSRDNSRGLIIDDVVSQVPLQVLDVRIASTHLPHVKSEPC